VPHSEFQPAVDLVLAHEGDRFYHNSETGEVSRFGITLKLLDGEGMDVDAAFIRDLTRAQASDLYRSIFWDRYGYGRFQSQRLANLVFDAAVNMGPGTSARLLQSALSAAGASVSQDAILGPRTLAAVGQVPVDELLRRFCMKRVALYSLIAKRRPELAPNLRGWTERAYCQGFMGGCRICRSGAPGKVPLNGRQPDPKPGVR